MGILYILQGALTQNVILGSLFGAGALIGLARSKEDVRKEGTFLVALLMWITVTTWLIEHVILVPLHARFLRILIGMVLIGVSEQALERIFGWSFPPYRKAVFCAVSLGIFLQNMLYQRGFSQSLYYALGAGLGYLLVLVMLLGLNERLKHSKVPEPLRGLPMLLLCAAIMSMAFSVFLSF